MLQTRVWIDRLYAVALVEMLHLSGVQYSAAAERVVSLLSLVGVSKKDVLSWRVEFRKGKVKHREAAMRYSGTMSFLKDLQETGSLEKVLAETLQDTRHGLILPLPDFPHPKSLKRRI